MARTAGAISNVAISLEDLFRVLGIECPETAKLRKIVVSAKWLTAQIMPCDMVTITAAQLAALHSGLSLEVSPVQALPASTVTANNVPRDGMEEIPELDDLLG